jgi:hypothetical protein
LIKLTCSTVFFSIENIIALDEKIIIGLLLFDSVGMADVEVDHAKDDKDNGQHNLSQPAIHQQRKTLKLKRLNMRLQE